MTATALGGCAFLAGSGDATSGVGITSSTKSGTGAVSDQIMVAPDIAGVEVTADKLDECNGIFSSTPEFPNGIHHYVLPNTTDETSSIRCVHGKVDASQIRQMPPTMGAPEMMGPPPANPAKKP